MIKSNLYQKWVLSLDSATKRRELFFSQEYAKSFLIHTAIDAKKNEHTLIKQFDFSKAKKLYNRTLSLGEAACTLSHINIWRKLAEDEVAKFAIICEDDALFSDNYFILFNIIEDWIRTNRINDIGFIIFGESKVKSYKGKLKYRIGYPMQFYPKIYKITDNQNRINKICVGELAKNYMCGTVGYIISNLCAKELIKYDKPYWLADDFEEIKRIIEDQTRKEIGIWHIYPRLVRERNNIVSTLEIERKKEQKNSWGFFKYKVWTYIKFLLKCPLIYFFLRWKVMNQANKRAEIVLKDQINKNE
ncbi:hypothetical protein QV06_06530 [Gallibacterium genomosp. 3]|uniref:Glycosyl transferase family 25 domain-containing protein n=1 Tax=Gallibacterium genomosp. 3 TaxID=505345 RepID=A0A1A7PQH5_9PAST|nr:glycosyltransferase family 25 protein [Gallibacterium genomosp. 3]OBX04309.1 hypothetical protein QV06_06530 [Gallibacterium genomosp. 3]